MVNTVQIDHVTFSESGGAGEVARLLCSAQREIGLDAKLITLVSQDLRSQPLTYPSITLAAAVDEYAVSSHVSKTLVSLFRSRLSYFSRLGLRENSIVHIHWSAGVLTSHDIKNILALGRKVILTLHDMAPFTGACHHSHGCRGFEGSCEVCPQVRKGFQGMVSKSQSEKILLKPEQNLAVVSPTPWLTDLALRSTVLKHQRILTIENPVRHEFFELTSNIEKQRKTSLFANSPTTVTVVASDLTNPAKGINELTQIYLAASDQLEGVQLQLIGGRGAAFHDPSKGIFWLGTKAASELAVLASESDLLVSASVAESAGLTVREFGALAVPTLALAAGGIGDLIEHGKSGWLVDDMSEFQGLLIKLIKNRDLLRQFGYRSKTLSEANKPNLVAQKYIDVYKSLMTS